LEETRSYYRIYIQGHIGQNLSDWLQAFQIDYIENGVTVLTVPVIDQAALRGVINRLFDLGISIISIQCLGFQLEGNGSFLL